MKKLLDIVITLCVLGAAVALCLTAGPQVPKLLAGPEALAPGEAFRQAEGEYISYEAAYPVASYEEEYYSGDPDRVRTRGYVVYDEQRREFVYVIISTEDGKGLGDLMWNLKLMAQLRESKDMSPVPVEGVLEPMGETEKEHVIAALEDSEILSLYEDYGDPQETQGYYDAYFSDSYGRTLAAMGEELAQGRQQADWYVIRAGRINGYAIHEIWISLLAAALSLLIFAVRVIGMLTGGRSKAGRRTPDHANKAEELLEAQREWVEEWCDFSLNRVRRMAYLTAFGCVALFMALGLWVNPTLQQTLVFHLPLGLLLGEAAAALLWVAQKGQSKPDKIMKKLKKNLEKNLPSPAEQEDAAEDILSAGAEWRFGEKVKDSMLQGTVGSRYWVSFSWNGMVTVVDSQRLGEIETVTISGQVRSGKVRISYRSYGVRFYYGSASPKKTCDASMGFQLQDTQGYFMVLVRKRVGDSIRISSSNE